MEPDFSLIYSELNLPADCSLEEFKCAYRRRIAELHPDKTGALPSPESLAALPALISTYGAVNRFHRRHGRMPGASPRSSPGSGNRPNPPESRTAPIHVAADGHGERPARPTWQLIILFVALLVLLAAWDWLTLKAAGMGDAPSTLRQIPAAVSARPGGTAPLPPSAAGSSGRTPDPGS